VTLDEVADELYGLTPEEFTAARDAVVKAASAETKSSVKALRKPTVSAYVVNALVRARRDDVEELVVLGDEMRAAMGGKGDIRALTEQRRTAIADLVAAAPEAADRELTAAQEAEVAATLEAATADPDLGAAVLSGRLVKPLRYAGFGTSPDLTDALATPLTPRTTKPASKKATRANNETATKKVQPAKAGKPPAATSKSQPDSDDTKARELTRLRSRVLDLAGIADDAQRRYDQASRAVAEARQLLDAAEKERSEAHKAANAAHREAEKARRELGRLERS
jgi:hypothetical protein